MSVIQLPEDLRRRVEAAAADQGESMETFIQETLEERLQRLGTPHSRQRLLEALEQARAEYAASGEPWLDREGIAREVAARRGGYQAEAE
jgi:hypothetical protein